MAADTLTMPVTRIYTGDDQQSHFEQLNIPMGPHGIIGHLSEKYPASGVIFRHNDGDYDYDWHNAPARQYIVILEGELEVTVGSGEKRVFRG